MRRLSTRKGENLYAVSRTGQVPDADVRTPARHGCGYAKATDEASIGVNPSYLNDIGKSDTVEKAITERRLETMFVLEFRGGREPVRASATVFVIVVVFVIDVERECARERPSRRARRCDRRSAAVRDRRATERNQSRLNVAKACYMEISWARDRSDLVTDDAQALRRTAPSGTASADTGFRPRLHLLSANGGTAEGRQAGPPAVCSVSPARRPGGRRPRSSPFAGRLHRGLA